MTREEAINELEALKQDCLKQDYWDDDGYEHEINQYDDTMLALDIAIEALGQELILNKIIAEIGKAWHKRVNSRYEEGLKDQALKDMQIIDKYMANIKEGEDGNDN